MFLTLRYNKSKANRLGKILTSLVRRINSSRVTQVIVMVFEILTAKYCKTLFHIHYNETCFFQWFFVISRRFFAFFMDSSRKLEYFFKRPKRPIQEIFYRFFTDCTLNMTSIGEPAEQFHSWSPFDPKPLLRDKINTVDTTFFIWTTYMWEKTSLYQKNFRH